VAGLRPAGAGAIDVIVADGSRRRARAVVNCAGLFADEVARMAGDDGFAIYPRKGEFLVFDPPAGGPGLERILLPVPSDLGKGVLVFPAVDGRIVAGPTARERTDKRDWSVEPDAEEMVMARAREAYPPLEACTTAGSYAGLRPAGRGVNYVIERSGALENLIHVAAIRSTGLSAALAIGEHVVSMLAGTGAIDPRAAERAQRAADAHGGAQPPGPPLPVTPGAAAGARPDASAHAPAPAGSGAPAPWWRRAADYRGARR